MERYGQVTLVFGLGFGALYGKVPAMKRMLIVSLTISQREQCSRSFQYEKPVCSHYRWEFLCSEISVFTRYVIFFVRTQSFSPLHFLDLPNFPYYYPFNLYFLRVFSPVSLQSEKEIIPLVRSVRAAEGTVNIKKAGTHITVNVCKRCVF